MALDVSVNFEGKLAKDFFAGIQKNILKVTGYDTDFGKALGAVVYKDVIDHFEFEQGEKGPWKWWSDVYADHMARVGKGGNKILQDSGRLRNNFKPGNFRRQPEGLEWFNDAKTKGGFPYAYAHDEGGPKLPKRDFMWASARLMDNVSRITLAFALRGKLNE